MSAFTVIDDAELAALHARIAGLKSEVERLRAALNAIASWSEGPVVHGGFDEPHSAQMARTALALPVGFDANGSEVAHG